MPDAAMGLEVVPVLSYPRQAEAGRTYLMTVDLRPFGEGAWAAGLGEEVLFRCVLNAYPLFRCEAVGDPSLVCHRFGGTYGPARFLLTAADAEQEGTLHLTLANEWGVPVALYETDRIQVRRALEAEPAPTGLRVVRPVTARAVRPAEPAIPEEYEPDPPVPRDDRTALSAAAAFVEVLSNVRAPAAKKLRQAVAALLGEVGAGLSPPVHFRDDLVEVDGRRIGGLVPDDSGLPSSERPLVPVPSHGVVEIRPSGEPLQEYARGRDASLLWRDYGKVLLTNGWEFLLLDQDADGRPVVADYVRLESSSVEDRLFVDSGERSSRLRSVDPPGGPAPGRREVPLTVLFSSASPMDLPRLRADMEMREVREALELSIPRGRFTLELRPALRPRDFARALLELRPRVVHFSGPGLPETGELSFEDDAGTPVPVGPEGLRGLFAVGRTVECVVLNGCYTHAVAASIAESVPYVIGTPPELTDEAAIAFAVGFYQALGEGMTIPDAHQWGSALMRMAGLNDPLPELVQQSASPPRRVAELARFLARAMERPTPRALSDHALVIDARSTLDAVSWQAAAEDLRLFYEWLVDPLGGGLPPASVTVFSDAENPLPGARKLTDLRTALEEAADGGLYGWRMYLYVRGAAEGASRPEVLYLPEGGGTDSIATVGRDALLDGLQARHAFGEWVMLLHCERPFHRPSHTTGVRVRSRPMSEPRLLAVEWLGDRDASGEVTREIVDTLDRPQASETNFGERLRRRGVRVGTNAPSDAPLVPGSLARPRRARVLVRGVASGDRLIVRRDDHVEVHMGADDVLYLSLAPGRYMLQRQGEEIETPLKISTPRVMTFDLPLRTETPRDARTFNFTHESRRVLAMAREEAVRLHHGYVGTDHMLMALTRSERGAGAVLLRRLGLDPEIVYDLVQRAVVRGKATTPLEELPYSSGAKRVLEFAADELRRARHDAVSTDYLLLAMIRQEKGTAAIVLASRGVTIERALAEEVRGREEIAAARGAETPAEPPHPIRVEPPPVVRSSGTRRFALESGVGASGYNFTDRVRLALAMAREEAIRLQHDYVGTEHILLGLLSEGEGMASAVLHVLGEEPTWLVHAVETSVRRGKATIALGELPYTSRAKKVLEFAMAEARQFGHTYVGTQHLLLGLIREEKGIAAEVLRREGVTLEQVRGEVKWLHTVESSPVPEELVRHGPTFQPAAVRAPATHPESEHLRLAVQRAGQAAADAETRVFPEHLMQAALREPGGTAAAVVRHLDVDVEELLRTAALLRRRKTGPRAGQTPARSAAAASVLARAAENASRFGGAYVGTQHLLLALVQTHSEPPLIMLREHGVDADAIISMLRRLDVVLQVKGRQDT